MDKTKITLCSLLVGNLLVSCKAEFNYTKKELDQERALGKLEGIQEVTEKIPGYDPTGGFFYSGSDAQKQTYTDWLIDYSCRKK